VFITLGSIASNKASNNGGGIAAFGSLSLTNATVTTNTAGLDGGGIYTGSAFTSVNIFTSTIDHNTAGVSGGGLALETFGGFDSIQLSTIGANKSGSGFGGGIFVNLGSTGSLNLVHDTIAFNLADFTVLGTQTGAGIYGQSGAIAVRDDLVAQNTLFGGPVGTKSNFAGSGFTSGGFNLTDDPTNDGFLTNTGDHFGVVSSGLSTTLALNQGGKTKTYALVQGTPANPAIGGGDSDLVNFAKNQNGAAWLKGPSDIGSY
jgi:predicted outer membrane repeat protein